MFRIILLCLLWTVCSSSVIFGEMNANAISGYEGGLKEADQHRNFEGVSSKQKLETQVIPLLHTAAKNLLETLNVMKSERGEIAYHDDDSTLVLKDLPLQLKEMSAYVKKIDVLLETAVIKVNHVDSADIIDQLRSFSTEGVGRLELDEAANSIAVTDTPSTVSQILERVRLLDKIVKEIMIDYKILQIVLNDEHPDGIDWEAIISDFQEMHFGGFTGSSGLGEKSHLSLGTVSGDDYSVLLEALDTVGAVYTVSDQSLRTDHEKSTSLTVLSSALHDAYRANENQNDTAGQGRSGEGPVDVAPSEAVRFDLIPRIEDDNGLSIDIEPVLVQMPSKRAQRASSKPATISIISGETVVIGSLFEDVVIESSWRVPVLGSIPLLGVVFRNQAEEQRKTETILFLTVQSVEKKS